MIEFADQQMLRFLRAATLGHVQYLRADGHGLAAAIQQQRIIEFAFQQHAVGAADRMDLHVAMFAADRQCRDMARDRARRLQPLPPTLTLIPNPHP